MRRTAKTIGLVAWLLVLPALVTPAGVFAQGDVRGDIRFEPATRGVTWVGQEVELNLELWSNAFAFGDQLWVLPEVKGGYLMQADSSTVKLSEDREGVPWQGLRYTLLFFPQRAGRLEVPSFEVQFTARAGYGSEPARFQYRTPVITLEAQLPPGVAPGGLLVTTDSFELQSTWVPEITQGTPVELNVGDALTLRVTRRAQDVPGMVFTPLPRLVSDGLAAYPEAAVVDDRINRGSLTGSRTDSVTYICEHEGRYTIPEFRFQWWDPTKQVLSENVIPAVELVVSANPGLASGSTASSRLRWPPPETALIVLIAAVLTGFLAWWGLPFLRSRWRKSQERRETGEAWAFRNVRKACAGHSAAAAYNAIGTWLGRYQSDQPGLTLNRLALQSGDPALLREARSLQEHVIAQETRAWSGHELARLLGRFRRQSRKALRSASGLNPINPPMVR